MALLKQTQTATIASSGTVSGAVTVPSGYKLAGLITPAALTGTAFTFNVSVDLTTFVPLYNGGTQLSVTVSTSRYVSLDTEITKGISAVQVVSGSAEGAARSITLIFVRE